LIAWDVSQHFSKQWKGTGLKGRTAAPGKKEALILKGFFDQFGKVGAEVIISGPTEIENPEERPTAEEDESVERFWKAMMAKADTEKEYNRRIIDSFEKGEDPEIIIVVDKPLTRTTDRHLSGFLSTLFPNWKLLKLRLETAEI